MKNFFLSYFLIELIFGIRHTKKLRTIENSNKIKNTNKKLLL